MGHRKSWVWKPLSWVNVPQSSISGKVDTTYRKVLLILGEMVCPSFFAKLSWNIHEQKGAN